MKPFVLLATRAEDLAADAEYELFLRYAGLDERDLIRVRLEAEPMPPLDLDALSGIFVGGGPFNASDPPELKSPVQHRVEAEFRALLDEVVPRDFPFLGACYGVGTLGAHQGAPIDRTYSEPVGVVPVTLTEAGASDPLLAGMPSTFNAFVGHKEAIRTLPPTAIRLASSPTCPVQMFRVGQNVYATQFHPELDLDGIVLRIHAYSGYGYFADDEIEATMASVRRAPVSHPNRMLRNFVERYAR
ncbi:glutamine amidotransferase [Agromyces sp. Marseille-P2726]|uniref:glutamine amidotransferase n=1 Tax=Agromyces sp. Marseille-P2726 TaxID=2709132 RepID=UPI001570C8EC|nr:glutamine amidotransferase [Agromyces sp. Marseille-P2726]